MSLKEYQRQILGFYLELELNMATLYDLFAGGFPDQRGFWLSMATEEREHASWVQFLLDRALGGEVRFAEGKLRATTVSTVNSYVGETVSRFRKSPFDIVHAAAIALDLERSLIEKNVFRTFHDDSAEVSRILQVLVEGQELHVKKIEQFAASVQGGTR
jgi:hypothetical protein